MSEPYRLFFREIELGTIIEDDSDFPNLFGAFKPADKVGRGELWRYLQEYIEQSIIGNGLMEDNKIEEWECFIYKLSEKFPDLIETDDWYLLSDDKREPITVPIFGRDNSINWRWN